MKFYQLNALVAVADAGSIRGAAKRLDTSPAAVTKALQKLEADTATQLLIRNTSGIAFTELGFGTAPIGNLYKAVNPEDAQKTLEHLLPERIIVQPFSWGWYFDTARACKLYDFGRQCWTDFRGRATGPMVLTSAA